MLSRLLPSTGSYEPMTALDAGFLHAESDRAPMHLGSLARFEAGPFVDDDGRFRIEAVRDHVLSRLDRLPRFRTRVAVAPFGQGRPVWVDDDRFAIEHHVRLVGIPRPGTRAQLAELVGWIQSHPLDRHRPLWELWFVEGLDDGSVALVEKLHHALVDGISGVDVAAALLDLEPQPADGVVADPPAPGGDAWRPTPAPDPLQLLLRAELDRLARPARWGRQLAAALPGPTDIGPLVDGLVDAARAAIGTAVRPHPLTDRIGADRALAWTVVPLDGVRDLARRRGAKVNDVALALVAGGVHRVLAGRGGITPDTRIEILVPVSTRTSGQSGQLGNRVAAMLVELPVGGTTPERRLDAVTAVMADHKAHHQSTGTEFLLDGLEVIGPFTLSFAAQVVHHQPLLDLVVTNVPGPSCPLYFMGARMLEAVPIVPLGGNLAMGVAVLSYDTDLAISVFSDGDAAAEARRLIAGVEADAAQLLGATVADPDAGA